MDKLDGLQLANETYVRYFLKWLKFWKRRRYRGTALVLFSIFVKIVFASLDLHEFIERLF